MQSKKMLSVVEARKRAFNTALTVLANAKQRHSQVSQHRAISRLPMGPYLLLQTILLPFVFCGVLLWAQPNLFALWHDCILFWASVLDIPLQANAATGGMHGLGLSWFGNDTNSYFPSHELLSLTFAVTTLAFAASFKMNRALLPLKYLIRILCAVQSLSLLYFLFFPYSFPYTIASHLVDMTDIGYVLLVASPVMLALGYYVLDISVATKFRHTLMILAYFIIMIPHQAVLHTLILQHFSLLFMPVLYFFFGALFDVLVFVALYSWAASTIPAQATT